ncbi:HipA N-terminal domain protein [Desulfonatronospira thiodismutans ASO3-1]|uniref:HipA N-terminal domain protein n=1 Tax=Desulfonatronospira thiodismutans ASO3-1 TaxID=555779 RepID=D6SNB0_9BACT|nr:type II toxin-antitoxin system HipA family toxin [Desulfonatronospira thiodismutans]EFI34236.1 HipA N-terminal domain protein [Desulfonatronospira thiodismutans ASO3-1]
MDESLLVYFNETLTGKLWLGENRTYHFRYFPEWLRDPHSIPLSVSLPLQDVTNSGDAVKFFFANILPEGSVRDRVAAKLGLSTENIFSLLRELGGDCAGAISLYPEGALLPERQKAYRKLSALELEKIAADLPKRPLLAGEDGLRLSLAGAQDKLPLRFDGKSFYLPVGGAPSTHIFKPSIPHLKRTVFNEAFCMALARASGLPAPECTVLNLGSNHALLVARYDRLVDYEEIRRVHQEDFCQALGQSPEIKYEAEGGPGLKDCSDLLRRHSASPARDLMLLLRWTLFNVLLGNADAHAKNLSLLYDQGKAPRLAPFYDLISTLMYQELSRKLAMKIGGENRPEWLMNRHWCRMAEELDLKPKFVLDELGLFCQAVREAVDPALEGFAEHSSAHTFLGKLAGAVKDRTERNMKEIN